MRNKNTLFIGKVFLHFQSLESTNQYALELISKSKPIEGTVISTFNQTKGRGQIGSNWESDTDKNLTISLILYPTFLAIQQQFVLNQIISLAVKDWLLTYTTKVVKVKWPNDIYINDKKIAGILIQNSISGKKIGSTIIGMGININQNNFAKELPKATSLHIETNQTFDLNNLIKELCFYLEVRYLQLKNKQVQKINQDYLNSLYKYQEVASFQRNQSEEIFTGIIRGISSYGKLQIEHEKGLEEFNLKEITFK